MTNHMEGRLSQIRGGLGMLPLTPDLSATGNSGIKRTSIEVDIPKIRNLQSNSKPQMILNSLVNNASIGGGGNSSISMGAEVKQ
jgi:hypothetical protein